MQNDKNSFKNLKGDVTTQTSEYLPTLKSSITQKEEFKDNCEAQNTPICIQCTFHWSQSYKILKRRKYEKQAKLLRYFLFFMRLMTK